MGFYGKNMGYPTFWRSNPFQNCSVPINSDKGPINSDKGPMISSILRLS
jgi:hypothetical protein